MSWTESMIENLAEHHNAEVNTMLTSGDTITAWFKYHDQDILSSYFIVPTDSPHYLPGVALTGVTSSYPIGIWDLIPVLGRLKPLFTKATVGLCLEFDKYRDGIDVEYAYFRDIEEHRKAIRLEREFDEDKAEMEAAA